jgi:hypothetical protein
VEVVEVSQVSDLPNFGIRSIAIRQQQGSGYLGVVSREAYKIGPFSPARVQKLDGGYEITRWIFTKNSRTKEERIQKVKELVKTDGEYHRTILENRVPPHIPGVLRFWLPTFE